MAQLQVTVLGARGLVTDTKEGVYEPGYTIRLGRTKYVGMNLKSSLPKPKNSSPVWQQTWTFNTGGTLAKHVTIKVVDILDDGAQVDIGDLHLPLKDLVPEQEVLRWYKLENCAGEIQVKLVFRDDPIPIPQPQPSKFRPGPWPVEPRSDSLAASHDKNPFTNPLTNHVQNPFQPQTNPFLQSSVIAPPPLQQPAHTHPPSSPQPHVAQPTQPVQNPSPAIKRGYFTRSQGHMYQGTLGPFQPPKLTSPPRTLVNYPPEELQREENPFARGAFGKVYRGKVPGMVSTVCIKDTEIRDQKAIDDWKKEVALMSQNRSPYIAEVFGFSWNDKCLTIVMEFFPQGDLFHMLHKKSHEHRLSLLQRMRMARHCALGVQTLHSNNILHRDIKSMNILVTEDYACKLTDFGCSKLMSELVILQTMGTGTPLWMAPEVPSGIYSYPADIYSLGLVLYELFEKKIPDYNSTAKCAVLPSTFSSAQCVLPLVNANPQLRPTARKTVKALDGAIRRTVQAVYNSLPADMKKRFTDEADMPESFEQDKLELYLMQLYQFLLATPPEEADVMIETAFAKQGVAHQMYLQEKKQQVQPSSPAPHAVQPPAVGPRSESLPGALRNSKSSPSLYGIVTPSNITGIVSGHNSPPPKSPRLPKYSKLSEEEEDVDLGDNPKDGVELNTPLEQDSWTTDESSDDTEKPAPTGNATVEPKKQRKRSKSGLRQRWFGKTSGKKGKRKSSPHPGRKQDKTTKKKIVGFSADKIESDLSVGTPIEHGHVARPLSSTTTQIVLPKKAFADE